MRAISEKLLRIEKIINKFESIKDEFIDIEKRLKKTLADLLDQCSNDFDLSKENSVRKLKFYSVVSRVKEFDSLSEKLVRNNDYNKFDDILQDLENYNQLDLKTKIKELDDIIGIKILTDLNIDTVNMYKLISSSKFIELAKNSGILLNENDLKKQPVKMKNGLNIYKVRCKFDEWNFELQIKSKLESAWGDMEHSIFYKDYKITPVRDLAQQSMNHIGKLLLEIDNFLQEIRNANENFSINSKVILFINQFEEKYSPIIRDKLNGISFNFKKIASVFYNIFQINGGIINSNNINTDYQNIDCQKYNSYIKFRNEDFDLQIFEAIILSNITESITDQNIETSLDTYFGLIKESYVKMTLDNHLIQDEELANEIIEIIFDVCNNYNCKEYILNTKNLYYHIGNIIIIIDSIEVLELDREILNQIISIYTIHSFDGDILEYCKTIDKDILTENLEKAKLEIEKISNDAKHLLSKNFSKLISSLN
ncbi:hypothetical protein LF887_20375 [Chryseobacterium sp. MEBOG06]|uniref:hypothetical protein n=1 Tax=Chryseobacterium sp. MEBOG06 TaxID=2879938 RepID=UPI001F487BF2|nr:hypothetical protein [Chryseobacterium sp. MEBOG06]UKB83342.1 hypothetical protein LF887_20375 [Chryseobacterium sp. MEBOG06]